MEYKMKILDKYIDPINTYQKTKEYRLYDEERQRIKIGDTLLLVADRSNNRYVRVRVNGINVFSSWEDSLKDSWKQEFSFTNIKYDELLKEFQAYYRNDLVKKYGIIVFDIEPMVFRFKDSSVLIDTNTIIYRESHLNVNFEVAELYRWFDKLRFRKLIHPETRNELNKYGNEDLKKVILSKLYAYQEIVPNSFQDDFFKSVVKNYALDANGLIDNQILLQVYNGIADFLVTNDKSLIRKASDLYLSDRVLSVADFLKKIEDENPDLVTYKMLSVREKKFGEVDLNNSFFDTLKEDYSGFDKWFLGKNAESAYVFEDKNDIKGFLYLKTEDEYEEYSKIEPKFSRKKRLKVGTFKIIRSGFRLGERFLKIIFDNAVKHNVDEIYVTMFEDKRDEVIRLREFMMGWGFIKHGYKTNDGELVLIKDMRKYRSDKSPKFNFPLIKDNPPYYFLPIEPQYHTDLFPDNILKNEDINLYKDNYAHRYAIEKIYVSGASDTPSPGGIVLIYRNGEIKPKKYSSVVTGLAIIEDITIPKNIEEYLNECEDRSVFNQDELREFYKENRWRKIIKVLNYKTFDRKVTLNDLYKMGIIEKSYGPRTFTSISKENYDKIIKEGWVNQ